jgi:hypothetical protein
MNDPITLATLAKMYLGYMVGTFVLAPIAIFALTKTQRPQCETCARPMQWRARKPSVYARRWWCPYHDETVLP